jgi:hypothetical protein
MLEAGKNVVMGLWNGITSMGSWLADKISGFAGGIIDDFKDAFGIASPSKVMRDLIGKNIAQGVGVGFIDEIPKVGKEALAAFDGLKAPILSASAQLRGSVSGNGYAAAQPQRSVINNYFTQNNTSPKALSRLEIYRQSKNLLSMKGAI